MFIIMINNIIEVILIIYDANLKKKTLGKNDMSIYVLRIMTLNILYYIIIYYR